MLSDFRMNERVFLYLAYLSGDILPEEYRIVLGTHIEIPLNLCHGD